MIDAADLLDVGFFVPEVALPIAGVFLGVVALGGTVIGFLYAPVGRAGRAGFALAALLLMAPGLLLEPTLAALPSAAEVPLAIELSLRGVGAVLFAALVVWNRRGVTPVDEAAPDAGPA